MEMQDWLGALGVGLILLAYFLSVFSFIEKEGSLFFLLNIVGSAFACIASVLIQYIPFVVLEGVWFLVSVLGFMRLRIKTK
jgi:hypothetical protein